MRLLSTSLLLAIASASGAAEITLRDEATGSAGTLVRLGDVATVTGDDAERLARLALMPNPSPGTRQFVSAAAVRSMLAAQGESVADHRFGGAYRVRVETPELASEPVASEWKPATRPDSSRDSTAFRLVPRGRGGDGFSTRLSPYRARKAVKQAVLAAVQTAIDAWVEADGARLAVIDVELTETAMRELAEMIDQPITAKAVANQTVEAGAIRFRLWPEARLGGEAFNAVARVVEQPMRAVVAVPVARGALITASSVRLEPVPVKELDRPTAIGYSSLEQVVGREAKRPLRLGETLSDNNTAAPLVVRRNEEVEIISGGGGITVTLTALAKQDGRQGDLISVRLLDRREEFTARVVGPRQLAVLSARSDLAVTRSTGGF